MKVLKVPDPGAGVVPRPSMGAENWNFLKLIKTKIVGALWFRLGLLCISILLKKLLNWIQNDGVMAPNAGRKNVHGG